MENKATFNRPNNLMKDLTIRNDAKYPPHSQTSNKFNTKKATPLIKKKYMEDKGHSEVNKNKVLEHYDKKASQLV